MQQLLHIVNGLVGFGFMVFNATFNSISVSWWSVLLVEERFFFFKYAHLLIKFIVVLWYYECHCKELTWSWALIKDQFIKTMLEFFF